MFSRWVYCVMVFGHIPVDVIEASITHLHINLAAEHFSKKDTKAELTFLDLPASD